MTAAIGAHPATLALLAREPSVGRDALPSAQSILGTGAPSPASSTPSGPSFAERVQGFAEQVQSLESRADAAQDGYLRGEHNDVHGTMIAMQEADVSFRLGASIRNRAIEAYREIMRMSG